jgi:hypothetical protein
VGVKSYIHFFLTATLAEVIGKLLVQAALLTTKNLPHYPLDKIPNEFQEPMWTGYK